MSISRVLPVGASLMLVASGPVWAQSVAAEGSDAQTLNEIVVTAQRRAENLKEVPLSVTVATAADLDANNFTDPAQLPYLVPTLQVTSYQGSPGATNFSVRGVGTQSFSNLVEPSVATVIDGVVMGRPEMGVMSFSDLERVEVLSGPQGMLFGKNASAGLVNIVTVRPQLNETDFQVHSSFGELSNGVDNPTQFIARATANLPIGTTAAARITGFYSDTQPFIRDVFADIGDYGEKQAGIRAKFLFEPTDDLSLYFSADWTESTGVGTGAFTARAAGPTSGLLPFDQALGIVPGPTNVEVGSNASTTLHYGVGGAQLEADYKFDGGLSLTNILAYRQYNSPAQIDFDLTQVNILDYAANVYHLTQITDELRLASNGSGPLTWQAGLYFYNGVSDRTDTDRGLLNLGPPPPGDITWLGLDSRSDLLTQSYAAYGQGTYKFTDQYRLTVGARVTNDELHDLAGNGAPLYPISVSGTPGPVSYDERINHTNVSWRTSFQDDFTRDLMGYATIASGYKGPGFNLAWAGHPGAAPVGPETSMDYEIGIKSTFFQTLTLNASLYYEEFKDFQTQSYLPGPTPGSGTDIVQNAGRLSAKGIEAQAQWNATGNLKFSAGFNYNEAVYAEFPLAPCYPGQTAAQGCAAGFVNASGNNLTNAPRWTGTLAGDFHQPINADLTALVHADVYSLSAVNFSPNLDPSTAQSGYTLFNASVGLGGAHERWKASLFCRNCFDRRFVTFIGNNPAGGPTDYDQSFALDSFRMIGISADLRF
jgi:iron complex outermembrane receptor protein